MLIRRIPGPPRRGAVVPWLVVTAPVLLAVFVLAVEVTSLRHRQAELQNAADAAASAAADRLGNDDRLLTGRPDQREALLQDARAAAVRYAGYNWVESKPLALNPNPQNFTDGELVFGALDGARSQTFDAQSRTHLNAVHVALKRGGAAAETTALIDHDVIGFRVQDGRPLPVVPLALLTDACPPGLDKPSVWAQKDPLSWEYQVLARKGSDAWSVRESGIRQGGDQIPEMQIVLSPKGADEKDNGRIAAIGVNSCHDACRQIASGVTAADLNSRGGQLMLDDGLSRRPPDNRLALPCLSPTAAELDALARALRGIIGTPRIWMLYEKQTTNSGDTVLVRGFVAARVLSVEVKNASNGKDPSTSQLVVTLQPCRMTTALAVTDRDRRDLGPRTLLNPYLGRVRLVE